MASDSLVGLSTGFFGVRNSAYSSISFSSSTASWTTDCQPKVMFRLYSGFRTSPETIWHRHLRRSSRDILFLKMRVVVGIGCAIDSRLFFRGENDQRNWPSFCVFIYRMRPPVSASKYRQEWE